LGGKIPRNIKEKVIRQWLHGLTRENIVKEDDIGAGTVTAIIQEVRKQEEYNDIDLLRQVSVRLKEEELKLPLLAFAIRLKKIMEENGINEDQIKPIIQDFAAYCLRHNISYDTVIIIIQWWRLQHAGQNPLLGTEDRELQQQSSLYFELLVFVNLLSRYYSAITIT
jgi:hypothetical protein